MIVAWQDGLTRKVKPTTCSVSKPLLCTQASQNHVLLSQNTPVLVGNVLSCTYIKTWTMGTCTFTFVNRGSCTPAYSDRTQLFASWGEILSEWKHSNFKIRPGFHRSQWVLPLRERDQDTTSLWASGYVSRSLRQFFISPSTSASY